MFLTAKSRRAWPSLKLFPVLLSPSSASHHLTRGLAILEFEREPPTHRQLAPVAWWYSHTAGAHIYPRQGFARYRYLAIGRQLTPGFRCNLQRSLGQLNYASKRRAGVLWLIRHSTGDVRRE